MDGPLIKALWHTASSSLVEPLAFIINKSKERIKCTSVKLDHNASVGTIRQAYITLLLDMIKPEDDISIAVSNIGLHIDSIIEVSK